MGATRTPVQMYVPAEKAQPIQGGDSTAGMTTQGCGATRPGRIWGAARGPAAALAVGTASVGFLPCLGGQVAAAQPTAEPRGMKTMAPEGGRRTLWKAVGVEQLAGLLGAGGSCGFRERRSHPCPRTQATPPDGVAVLCAGAQLCRWPWRASLRPRPGRMPPWSARPQAQLRGYNGIAFAWNLAHPRADSAASLGEWRHPHSVSAGA